MPLIMQYKTGTGVPITEWVDNTFWAANYHVVWTGSSWYYDGDYEGCDGCGSTLDAIGTWATGFRPTSVDVTIQTIGTINGHNGWIRVNDTGFAQIGSVAVPTPAGTNVINVPLTFTTNDIGTLNFYGGDCSGCTNYDREVYITSVVFNS